MVAVEAVLLVRSGKLEKDHVFVFLCDFEVCHFGTLSYLNRTQAEICFRDD